MVCFFFSVLQIEEEKQRKRQAKKEERAQKRKREKEPASKETEPKVKRVRQVKGNSEIINLLRLISLRLTYIFLPCFHRMRIQRNRRPQTRTQNSTSAPN